MRWTPGWFALSSRRRRQFIRAEDAGACGGRHPATMSRGRAAADRARALAGTRAGFVDVSVAVALSVGALFSLVPASSGFLTFLAVVCALGGTTAVAWRRRNPLLAAIVAAAGLAGYARLTHDHDMAVGPFA